jgi:hypothetical protein
MCSRRIVGFAIDEHHEAELAHAALAMDVGIRGGNQAWRCQGCSGLPWRR